MQSSVLEQPYYVYHPSIDTTQEQHVNLHGTIHIHSKQEHAHQSHSYLSTHNEDVEYIIDKAIQGSSPSLSDNDHDEKAKEHDDDVPLANEGTKKQ